MLINNANHDIDHIVGERLEFPLLLLSRREFRSGQQRRRRQRRTRCVAYDIELRETSEEEDDHGQVSSVVKVSDDTGEDSVSLDWAEEGDEWVGVAEVRQLTKQEQNGAALT